MFKVGFYKMPPEIPQVNYFGKGSVSFGQVSGCFIPRLIISIGLSKNVPFKIRRFCILTAVMTSNHFKVVIFTGTIRDS